MFHHITYLIEMVGTVAFAATAVLAVKALRITSFEAVVFAIITAVGGGTIRDVILDVPVFWLIDLNYIWVAMYSGASVYAARTLFTRQQIYNLMLYFDGLGAAIFGIQGTAKAWDLNMGLPIAPVFLGLITAIGGGLIRDVLAGQETLLMKRQFYAIPIVLGEIIFVAILNYLPEYRTWGVICGVLFIFAFRSAAIRWNLTTSRVSQAKKSQNSLESEESVDSESE